MLAWDGARRPPPRRQVMDAGARGPAETGRGQAVPRRPATTPTAALRWAVVAPLTVDDRVPGTLVAYAPRESAVLVRARPARSARWVVRTAGARRARPLPHPADRGRDPGAAGADLAALHLQLARRDRLVRPHRPGPGPRTPPGIRRLHPLLVPQARRLHHARRGTALHRPVLGAGAGPLRRPALGHPADRPRGAAGRPAVPVPAAAGGERRQARPRGPPPTEPHHHHRRWTRAPRRVVVIEDDGVRHGPGGGCAASCAARAAPSSGIGLSNVDERLRQVYGDDYGLVIETAVGAGMKVTVRVPKYRAGVHPSARPGGRDSA